MFTKQATVTITEAGIQVSGAFSIEAGGKLDLNELIPGGSNNLQITTSLDVSALKLLVLLCDRALVLETNSGSEPVNTFTLAAGVPFVWFAQQGALRDTGGTAVATDITALFATLAAGEDATFQMQTLFDVTP